MEKRKSVIIETNGPEETVNFGQRLAESLGPGSFVCVIGDLGAGKTTLIQGICIGLKVDPSTPVRSPTFTLVHEYKAPVPVRHADLYRVAGEADLETIGLFDPNYECVTLIEWADRLPDGAVSGTVIDIHITDISETGRRIEVSGPEDVIDKVDNP